MSIASNPSIEPQSVRMVDQHGQAVLLDVRQDGLPPSLVSPWRRTRFKIRTSALAYRVDRFVLGDCEHWHVHNIYVGGRSQLSSLGDSPEEDGVPGEVFSAEAVGSFVSFETTQTCMDLVLDVAYRGPAPEGGLLDCLLQCTVVRESDDVVGAPRASLSPFVGGWGPPAIPDHAAGGIPALLLRDLGFEVVRVMRTSLQTRAEDSAIGPSATWTAEILLRDVYRTAAADPRTFATVPGTPPTEEQRAWMATDRQRKKADRAP